MVDFPATSIGLLSSAVLNLNNMRDENSDRNANKNTLVVKLGKDKAKVYHFLLIGVAFLSLLVYAVFQFENWIQYFSFIGFIPLFIHLKKVATYTQPQTLDPELKKVALSTFTISILMLITQFIVFKTFKKAYFQEISYLVENNFFMDFKAKMLRDDALEGKTILVTGGGSGLGKSMSRYF